MDIFYSTSEKLFEFNTEILVNYKFEFKFRIFQQFNTVIIVTDQITSK